MQAPRYDFTFQFHKVRLKAQNLQIAQMNNEISIP